MLPGSQKSGRITKMAVRRDLTVISKRLKFTLDDRTDTNLIVTLRMHIYRSKSTLDSLKNANVFRWKLSMGAPD